MVLQSFGFITQFVYGWCYSIAYSGETGMIAAGAYDGSIRIWNVKTGVLVLECKAAP